MQYVEGHHGIHDTTFITIGTLFFPSLYKPAEHVGLCFQQVCVNTRTFRCICSASPQPYCLHKGAADS